MLWYIYGIMEWYEGTDRANQGHHDILWQSLDAELTQSACRWRQVLGCNIAELNYANNMDAHTLDLFLALIK